MKKSRKTDVPRTSTVIEPMRETPLSGSYDVVVAGGGIAGVAAAVAAARNGATVCLLDKTCALGGLATLGNVINWLPICDGQGRQVSAGLAEELLKLSVSELRQSHSTARFNPIPPCWLPGGDPQQRKKVRYRVDFNPGAYLLALEQFVAESAVKLLYDTRVCSVIRDAHRITHLIVENKGGRGAIACRVAVDATGDADVCFLAGEQTEFLDGNVLCGWFYYLQDGVLHLNTLSRLGNATGGQEGAEGPFFRGDDGEQVTAQILGSRALIRERLRELQAEHPDSDIQVLVPPTIPCFRMTRRLVAGFSLGERHVHQWFDDTVGLVSDWRAPGPVYAVPIRTLYGARTHNLLAAGRCMSVDTTAWDVLRSIPGCAVTGEAAGTAAALAVQNTAGDATVLSIPALQERLKHQGVLLNQELVRGDATGSNHETQHDLGVPGSAGDTTNH